MRLIKILEVITHDFLIQHEAGVDLTDFSQKGSRSCPITTTWTLRYPELWLAHFMNVLNLNLTSLNCPGIIISSFSSKYF